MRCIIYCLDYIANLSMRSCKQNTEIQLVALILPIRKLTFNRFRLNNSLWKYPRSRQSAIMCVYWRRFVFYIAGYSATNAQEVPSQASKIGNRLTSTPVWGSRSLLCDCRPGHFLCCTRSHHAAVTIGAAPPEEAWALHLLV